MEKIPNWTKSRLGQNPEWTKSPTEQKSRTEPTSKIERVRINSVITAGIYTLININNQFANKTACLSLACVVAT